MAGGPGQSKWRDWRYGLPALSLYSKSCKMRHNRGNESFKGCGVQKAEHKMRDSQRVEAFQLLDHVRAASSHEVLLLVAYHLVRIFRDTGRTQVGELDLRRVSAHANAVTFQHGKFARVLFNCTRIEIPPVGPARHD